MGGMKADLEQMLSTEDVAKLLGVSPRMVLTLPIKQHRLGPRTIRFRVVDIHQYLGIENPNE